MEKRTAEIIMTLKGHHEFGEFDTRTELLAAYMSDRCDCPINIYTDERLFNITKEAVKDYMAGCTGPGQIRVFLYDYFEAHKWYKTELEWWLSALSMVQVRESNGDDTYRYVNGFNDENTTFVKRNEYHKEK